MITTPTEKLYGNKGIYSAEKNTAELRGKVRIERGETKAGARKKPAIKRLSFRFSHGNGGRTGRFGHETQRLLGTQQDQRAGIL